MNERENRRHTRCSFCGKDQTQVRKLVAGPGVNPLGDEVLEELGEWWAGGPCV